MLSKKEIADRTEQAVATAAGIAREINEATGRVPTHPRPVFKGFRLTGDILLKLRDATGQIGLGNFDRADALLRDVQGHFRAKRRVYFFRWYENTDLIGRIAHEVRNQEVSRKLTSLRVQLDAVVKEGLNVETSDFEDRLAKLSNLHWQILDGLANPHPAKKAPSKEDVERARRANDAHNEAVKQQLAESAGQVSQALGDLLDGVLEAEAA